MYSDICQLLCYIIFITAKIWTPVTYQQHRIDKVIQIRIQIWNITRHYLIDEVNCYFIVK